MEKKGIPFLSRKRKESSFFHSPTFNKTKEQHITFAPKFDHCCHDSLHMRRRYSALLGRRHNSRWTHSPQTWSRKKMAAFSCYFRDFVGAQQIEDLTESFFFFAELLQITSKFVLAKRNWGWGHFEEFEELCPSYNLVDIWCRLNVPSYRIVNLEK